MMNALRVGEDSETRRLGGDASFGFLRSRARREQPVRNIERGLPCREGGEMDEKLAVLDRVWPHQSKLMASVPVNVRRCPSYASPPLALAKQLAVPN
jgi:hypothetical protein